MGEEFCLDFETYLQLHRFSPKTREAYLRSVSGLSRFHGQPPDQLTTLQIQAYLRHCIQDLKLAWSSCNVLFCGLKCYYRKYLGWEEAAFSIPRRPRSKQLPMLLSPDEVKRILEAPANLKHRTLLATVYGKRQINPIFPSRTGGGMMSVKNLRRRHHVRRGYIQSRTD